ncbi:hypothetical protein SAMN03159341_1197 [Paenibacillus sp. 1_12]|uniref:stalk domain-containing protein n=1 Tax=Paenibacillus sp. 1_12 TaxID=1566278 RepID=UPI0008E44C6C|nr:hypothetical protein [Paenibacillus sp. 1_12]SFM16869.1 hypothetical protein SAMN03159341_1197 [Paenibacillus sp. 1_12]
MSIVPKILIVMMLVFSLISPMSALADESNYTVYINNKKLDSEHSPFVENNIIYVPLWSVLGHLNMSAEDYDGVLRINHPYRILLIKADQNLMTYFGTSMEVNSARLDYPVVSKDYVLYAPLVFLQDYLDMQIAYGENDRIDITAGDYNKGVSWANSNSNKNTIVRSAKQLKLDADAESYWKEQDYLWRAATSSKINTDLFGFPSYSKLSIVGYSGSTVTLTNGEKTKTVKFNSMDSIMASLLLIDPLEKFSVSDRALIRKGNIELGMSKDMVIMIAGKPDKINTTESKFHYSEQWVYRWSSSTSYFYFDGSGKVATIQN